MIHDFKQKKVYRLVGITAASRLRGHIKDYSKRAYSQEKRREKEQARQAKKSKNTAEKADSIDVVPPAPVQSAKPVMLCASKMLSLEKIYLLALGEAGAFATDAKNAKTRTRDELLKKAGMRRKPRRPKPYESVAQQLRLRTAQAGLSATCYCDVRTIQRHLDDFEALGLVLLRQQLGLDRFGSPSFQLVLNADFLDWQEVTLTAYGESDNANSAPVAAAAPEPASAAPPSAGGAPPDVLKALTAVEQFEALRKKMNGFLAKS